RRINRVVVLVGFGPWRQDDKITILIHRLRTLFVASMDNAILTPHVSSATLARFASLNKQQITRLRRAYRSGRRRHWLPCYGPQCRRPERRRAQQAQRRRRLSRQRSHRRERRTSNADEGVPGRDDHPC